MNPSDLIDSARQRAGGIAPFPRGRPRQTDLPRAVSDDYYAMFHTLATSCADLLIGTGYAARRLPEWRQIYRALEHGLSRQQCNNRRALAQFPPEIQRFGRHFAEAQQLRHLADYDPDTTLAREDVLQLLIRERFAKLLSHSGESRNPEFAATKTSWIPAFVGMAVVYRGLVINARISN